MSALSVQSLDAHQRIETSFTPPQFFTVILTTVAKSGSLCRY
jgi:hypothetical protein